MFDAIRIRHRLENADRTVREAAILELDPATQSEWLRLAAVRDPDAELRALAAGRIPTVEMLTEMAVAAENPDDRTMLLLALDRLRAVRVLKSFETGAEDDPWFDLIRSPEVMAELLAQTPVPALALAAAARLNGRADLELQALKQMTDGATATEILQLHPLEEAALRELACSAASAELRAAAEALLAPAPAVESPEVVPVPVPSPEQDRALALAEAMEALEKAPDAEKLAVLKSDWHDLESGTEPEAAVAERFFSALYRCGKALEQQRNEEEEKNAGERQLAAIRTELENLAAAGPDPRLVRKCQRLQEALTVWNDRYGALLALPEEIPSKLAEWQQTLAAREAADAESLALLAETVTAMEALASGDPDEGKKRHGELCRAFDAAWLRASEAVKAGGEARHLKARFQMAARAFSARLNQLYQMRDLERWEHYTLKMDVCCEIEQLASLPDEELPRIARTYPGLRKRYFELGAVPQEKFAELKERYRNLTRDLEKRLNLFYAARDNAWKLGAEAKTALCTEAETLAEGETNAVAAERLKTMQQEWKALPAARPDRERELFARFRKACDTFFTRRSAAYEARRKEWENVTEEKKRLCTAAESLAALPFAAARRQLGELREEWKKLPFAGREDRELFARFNRAADRVFEQFQQEKEQQRKALEINCTAMLELAERAASGAIETEELIRLRQENCREWDKLSKRDDADGVIARRRLAALQQADAVIGAARRDRVRRKLEEQRQLERLSDAVRSDRDRETSQRRRQELCEALERRLVESGASFGGGDLAQELALAIGANFNRSGARLTADELDGFLRGFVSAGAVPGDQQEALFDRFAAACEKAVQFLERQ